MFDDVREFLKRVEELGDCAVIEGADWDLELGAITELQVISEPDQPLLLFDKIKGYEPGYRVMANFINTEKRFALAFDLPLDAKGITLVKAWRDRVSREFKPIPPVEVKTGPVMENIDTGRTIDIFRFPTPRWHERDGGRYIGTGSTVIQRDPDSGYVNLGAYRVQIHDKTTATIYISPGKHGDIIRRKYWDRGKSCPAAVVCGVEPLLWTTSHMGISWQVSEYDYAGWLRGKPVEVVAGKTTGLPIPAAAEIVLEGEIVPPGGEVRNEGPFGEYTGYYASGARDEPAFKVTSIMYRNNPIIVGAPPLIGPYYFCHGKNIISSGEIWKELDKQVPGVKGVWAVQDAISTAMVIISLEQKYAGHAKQAAMFVLGYRGSAYMARYIIVVDDDIDPSNISDVLWALGTRCDPAESIDITREVWGTLLDPRLSPQKRQRRELSHGAAIIQACKPYYWLKEFPQDIKASRELMRKTRDKWGKTLFG